MGLPWKRRTERKQEEPSLPQSTVIPASVSTSADIASFNGDLEDFTVLRHHATRALCGALMDRHTACKSAHPFCGPGHQRNGDTPQQLIVDVIPQGSTPTGGANRIGIYMCPASATPSGEENEDIVKYVVRLVPTQPVPNRKLVVFPPENGIYQAMYGPILNPVEGDYSTGSIDTENSRPLRCDPEPKHCRSQYWDSGLDKGDWLVPRFHCLQVFGAWWVVEVDQVRSVAQQVAALDFADNPDHNFGIHMRQEAVYARAQDDDSEYSKVLRENLPELL